MHFIQLEALWAAEEAAESSSRKIGVERDNRCPSAAGQYLPRPILPDDEFSMKINEARLAVVWVANA